MNINGDERNVKLRLKFGPGEVEYEGSEGFLKDHVIGIFERTLSYSPTLETIEPDVLEDDIVEDTHTMHLTTTSIASILNVNSQPELTIAAAARLGIVLGKENYTRRDLLDEMKQASGFYKNSFSRNLTPTISRLLKNEELLEVDTETYALPAARLKELKATLDQHR